MIGIGIDTGGTCTDAAVFDTEKHQVLSLSKTLTTKEDLKTGILKALLDLNPEDVRKARFISLSTTLATNACVEHKGGRAKLILIGADRDQISKTVSGYGLPPVNEIYFMAGDAKKDDSPENTPDWKKLKEDLKTEFASYDSVAIVQINPKYDNGAYEKRAEKIISDELGIPCVCGFSLYQELNILARAATALLNARLLPVMQEFFISIDVSLSEMQLDLPIVIVRSDGTIMSREFAAERPVETLLCGPAASIIGAMELSELQDAMIVDIGGTTSDVAFVKEGNAVSTNSGISIGEWRTMVSGVSIDTFALGGDTAVKYKGRDLYLDRRRHIPLCMLAARYPQIIRKLRTLVLMYLPFTYPAHEFFVLIKKPEITSRYKPCEQKLIAALEREPLMFREAAKASGISPHIFNTDRLEDEGIIIRSGMTPTDVMHIKGDYTDFNCEASKLGAAYLSIVTKQPEEKVCDTIYSLTKSRLYSHLVQILLKRRTDRDLTDEEISNLEKLTAMIFADNNSKEKPCLLPRFTTPLKLIGIGAPTKTFLEDVAELLGTEAEFPENRKVANAIGAAAGNINTECVIRIEAYKEIKTSYPTYLIIGGPQIFAIPDYDKALEEAKRLAKEGAVRRALQQGISGELDIKLDISENTYQRSKYTHPEYIDATVSAKAVPKKE